MRMCIHVCVYVSVKNVCVIADENDMAAFVYILNASRPELRAQEYVREYTIEMHETLYKPIKHIQVLCVCDVCYVCCCCV